MVKYFTVNLAKQKSKIGEIIITSVDKNGTDD